MDYCSLSCFEVISLDNCVAISYQHEEEICLLFDQISSLVSTQTKCYLSQSLDVSNELFSSFSHIHTRIKQKEMIHFIEQGSLVSYLQPIIDLDTNEIYGFEALLRAEDSFKEISPAVLFQTAIDTGMQSLLDKRARQCAVQAKAKHLPKGTKVFINFLPSTIYNPYYCLQHTFQLIEQYELDPADFVFEVVETEKVTDLSHLKKILQTYKEAGMKVALDDVGAGFSTLEMLQDLKPDFVKVDRHYISYCDQDEEKQRFLRDVIEIATKLDIQVLGEGIERKEELDYCKQIGMNYAQGYYLGKPALHVDLNKKKN